MLGGLFGNKSIEKTLFFLLVNKKVYATQLHRALHTPLTPLQKALEKLEREGVITSLFEGKTKFYAFNPHYPLLQELETLLKKAYALLTPQEKIPYYMLRHSAHKGRRSNGLLDSIWKQLLQTEKSEFSFRSQRGNQGHGSGQVKVDVDSEGRIIFCETGFWKGLKGEEFLFHNAFRWTGTEDKLTLEHLRLGINRPVFLFHLIPAGSRGLESAHAHICGRDSYFGRLLSKPEGLMLTWRILGPQKNEEVTSLFHSLERTLSRNLGSSGPSSSEPCEFFSKSFKRRRIPKPFRAGFFNK